LNSFSDELRLALVVLLNGGVLAAAYRFARRAGRAGMGQAVCDAFLLYFLVQYAAVAVPGVFGVFGTTTMACVAIAAAVVMWVAAGRQKIALGNEASFPSPGTPGEGQGEGLSSRERASVQKKEPPRPNPLPEYRAREQELDVASYWSPDRLGLLACTLFTLAYFASYAWIQSSAPPTATDSLVYHLPTAVQWIQTHRLGIYPTWYWNPAASYSPGTGSVFMAWWMAPAGNDVFVRFVQLPPLVFLFFLVVRLCRLLGCSLSVGGLVGLATVLSRPLFSEAIIPKDDLYVTSFIIAAILSLSDKPIRDRLGPWRVGVALGFVLASKYTVLLACPVFLFMVDSPLRARWRMQHWTIAISIAAVMAAPWYIRNTLLTGNPLYPVDIHLGGVWLHGLFGTERDQQLRTVAGVRNMLAETYHSLPTPLIVLLCVGWAGALSAGRSLLRDPLPRAVVIGSVATIALFLAASPHHEVRYIFPLIVLWFVAAGLGVARGLRRLPVQIGAAAIFALASLATTFSTKIIGIAAMISGVALLLSAAGVGAVLLQENYLRLRRDKLFTLTCAGTVISALLAYIYWHAYVDDYRRTRFNDWVTVHYPFHAPLWKWVDENVPANATLAYANTYFVYPYYGFDFTRRVVYAPVRRDLHDFEHFPRMGDRVPGDLIVRRMTEVMNEGPDLATWLDNLSKLGAEYMIVMKHDPDNPDLARDPPEFKLAGEKPGVFVPIYQDDAGMVYRIERR
jgi:hypothetical protein